jgi:XTP/dITP diphosphohydrolase
MRELVFATNNPHKIREIRAAAGNRIKILSLEDIGCRDDLPETADTLEENAVMKARYVRDHYGYDCFADDTGLEIEALEGRPGVYSARYAGPDQDSEKNIAKILFELQGQTLRNARFRTVIALLMTEKEHRFEGIANGTIRTEKAGTEGFGYDPVFQPDGYTITFAEMPLEEKNKISHRAQAVVKLVDFLHDLHDA